MSCVYIKVGLRAFTSESTASAMPSRVSTGAAAHAISPTGHVLCRQTRLPVTAYHPEMSSHPAGRSYVIHTYMKKGEIRRGKEARPNPARYAFKMNSSSVCLFLFPDGITLIKKSLNVKLLVEGGRAEYQGT